MLWVSCVENFIHRSVDSETLRKSFPVSFRLRGKLRISILYVALRHYNNIKYLYSFQQKYSHNAMN